MRGRGGRGCGPRVRDRVVGAVWDERDGAVCGRERGGEGEGGLQPVQVLGDVWVCGGRGVGVDEEEEVGSQEAAWGGDEDCGGEGRDWEEGWGG